VLAEQRTTDLMIALADMQRERDAWCAEAPANREQPPGFAIISPQKLTAEPLSRM
jgi:hypothetical protein